MLFKFLLVNLLLQLAFISCSDDLLNKETQKNIVFDLADLSIDYVDKNLNEIHLEAFKHSVNDLILKEGNNSKYGRLNWVSIGNPEIEVKRFGNYSKPIFNDFTQKGFSIRVQMLTKEHKMVFHKLIKKIYGIDVDLDQIVNLVPSKFDCKTSFYLEEEDKMVLITGSVENFNRYPLRIDFDAPKTKKGCFERCLFEKYIQNETNLLDLKFNC